MIDLSTHTQTQWIPFAYSGPPAVCSGSVKEKKNKQKNDLEASGFVQNALSTNSEAYFSDKIIKKYDLRIQIWTKKNW